MAYAFVLQNGTKDFTTGTSLALSQALTVGQRAIVMTMCNDSHTVSSLTDDGGNTYTKITQVDNSSDALLFALWEATIVAAATTITATYSATSTYREIAVYLYTGLTGAAQGFGNYTPTGTTGTDATAAGPVTPASQPGMLFGFYYTGYNNAGTAGTGFTDRGTNSGLGGAERIEDMAITSTSPVSVTWTASATTGTYVVLGVFIGLGTPAPVSANGWKNYLQALGYLGVFFMITSVLYGAYADDGRTYDPLVDATLYSGAATYTVGDMVTDGSGNYYISEDFNNSGNALATATWWYAVKQIMYFDSTSGVDSTRVPSTNPTTAKAAPFKSINQVGARTITTSGYSLFSPTSGALVLLKRGDSYDGCFENNGAQCYVASWGTKTSPRPIVNFRNNLLNGSNTETCMFGPYVSKLRMAGLLLDGGSKYALGFVSGASAFSVSDTLTGQTSGATAKVTWNASDTHCDVNNLTGAFRASEVVSNGASTATMASSSYQDSITGVWSYLSNQRAINSWVQNFTGNGMSMGYAPTPSGAADNLLIYNSTFTSNCHGGDGAGLYGGSAASSIRILQSSFYDNGTANDIFAHNIYLNDTTPNGSSLSCELANCHSYMTANYGNQGLVVHGLASGYRIHHNNFDSCNNGIGINDGYGSGYSEGFDDFQIYSNLIQNMGKLSGQTQGQSFDLACITNSTIYDNVISNCTLVASITDSRGIGSTDTPTNNLRLSQNTWYNTPGIRIRGLLNMTGSVMVQNEIYDNVSASDSAWEVGSNVSGAMTFDHNTIYMPNNSTPIRYLSTGPGSGGTLYSVAGLVTATSGALGGSSVIADPQFTNLGGGVYTLQSGSPAKAAGATGLGITTDFNGNLYSTPPNMGAFA